ncbi:MAG: two pore domain potassium channel family protein [Frankiales bacterium]|nr:two pore domain potassium channel family protein [Frankiales bacterium]
MRVLAPVLGVLLVVLVAVDAFRTVLLPTSSGGVSQVLSLGLWRAGRRLPQRVRVGVLRVTGPLALVLTVAAWLLLLLLAFALLYLPAVDGLRFSDQYAPADPGFGTALYLSGVALTTIGFGDVVGGSLPVRALTVVEAGAGLGVLTAALGYLPTIYTLVSELRTNNQAVADLGAEDVDGAAELLTVDAVLVLDVVRRDLLSVRQHLQRFPVLHYFHPPYDESVVALARGGLGLWVAAHFADDQDRPLPRHVKALEQALRRLSDAMLAHGGAAHDGGDLARARRTFERAREASPHRDAARQGEASDEAVALLAEVHAVLDAYAVRHDYPASDAP